MAQPFSPCVSPDLNLKRYVSLAILKLSGFWKMLGHAAIIKTSLITLCTGSKKSFFSVSVAKTYREISYPTRSFYLSPHMAVYPKKTMIIVVQCHATNQCIEGQQVDQL